jgi:tetratricopeptide (TPR) repeat protein
MLPILLILLLFAGGAAGEEDPLSLTRTARLRVQAYIASQDWDEAERQLLKLVERFPEDRYILGDLAFVYRQKGSFDQATALYRRLMERYPEQDSYRQDLLYLLFEAGHYAEVVELFDVDPAPPVGDLRRLLADALDRTGRSERAERFYDEALRENSEDFALLLMMGERHLRRGDPDRALPYFRQAHALQPRDPRLLKDLALAVQKDDPEQYRQYLLPVLVYDRTDAEVPYLLGEFYLPDQPQRAAKYYGEALRRLQKVERPDLYQQSLEARIRHRLGERQEAEQRFRALLEQNPRAADLRNDLAQLLVEEKRWDEALELLPADSLDTRAAWLRLTVHQQRRYWPGMAAELSFLADHTPGDPNLRLDLAEALDRTGRWPEALSLYDSLLTPSAPRPAAERAFELRLALRRERGGFFGLEGTHIGLPGERSWGLHPALRWQFSPRLYGEVRGIAGLYEDDQTALQNAFSENVNEGSLELTWALRPEWEVAVKGRGYLGYGRRHPGVTASTRYRLRRGGDVEFEGSLNQLWTEPVEAVGQEGLFHQAKISASTPLLARLYFQGQGSWRSLRVQGDQYFGRERKVGFSLGREFLRLPYGSSLPLRSANLSLSFESSWTAQEPDLSALIQLQKQTRTASLNLFLHLLPTRRTLLDLSFFVGLDPKRDLTLGELYGLGGEFHTDLGYRLALYAGGFFASESSLQATGGSYRQARIGLLYYFDYH